MISQTLLESSLVQYSFFLFTPKPEHLQRSQSGDFFVVWQHRSSKYTWIFKYNSFCFSSITRIDSNSNKRKKGTYRFPTPLALLPSLPFHSPMKKRLRKSVTHLYVSIVTQIKSTFSNYIFFNCYLSTLVYRQSVTVCHFLSACHLRIVICKLSPTVSQHHSTTISVLYDLLVSYVTGVTCKPLTVNCTLAAEICQLPTNQQSADVCQPSSVYCYLSIANCLLSFSSVIYVRCHL